MAILCRNTTEAINQLAFRLRLAADRRRGHHRGGASRQPPALGTGGHDAATSSARRRAPSPSDDVCAALDHEPSPALLAVTGASNVTGWLPPIEAIIDAAHERGCGSWSMPRSWHRTVPCPPRPTSWRSAGTSCTPPSGLAPSSGHVRLFESGDPFLAGGGAVDLVGLDEVIWTAPPDREEAGSPNVVGAVALHAAIDALGSIGWEAIEAHEQALGRRLIDGLAAIGGVRLLGPRSVDPAGSRRSRSKPSRWRPSPSTACTMRWWPPG